MTESTSVGNGNGNNLYLACTAFEMGKEKGKDILEIEEGNKGTFTIFGPEGTISLKPGATKELEKLSEYKTYNKKKYKMVEKFSKGKVNELKEKFNKDKANESER